MKKVRTYDDKKALIQLDKDYFFCYSINNGFSFNLHSADLVIDYGFNYTLQLNAFSKIYPLETGIIPNTVQDYLEKLIDMDYNNLSQIYDPYYPMSISDIGGQQLLINLDNDTTNISIIEGVASSNFPSPTEQLIYQLNEYLKAWIADRRSHYD